MWNHDDGIVMDSFVLKVDGVERDGSPFTWKVINLCKILLCVETCISIQSKVLLICNFPHEARFYMSLQLSMQSQVQSTTVSSFW